jgi:hypothetical protein
LRGAGTGESGRGHSESAGLSLGELNLVSDFLQEIIVRARA